jgi:hypothetical protein
MSIYTQRGKTTMALQIVWDWKLILAVCFIAALVLAIGIYCLVVFAILPHIDELILRTNKNTTVIHPGDKIVLQPKTSGIFSPSTKVVYYMSTDNGQIFVPISDSKGITILEPFEYVIPNNVYSDEVKFRVRDLEDAEKDAISRVVSIEPTFNLASSMLAKDVQVYVPCTLRVPFRTDSELITESNTLIEISEDGANWNVVSTHTYSTDLSQQIINWNVPSSLADTDQYVRISTNDLQIQGYPKELSVFTPHKVQFRESTSAPSGTVGPQPEGKDVTLIYFEDLQVRHGDSKSNSGAGFIAGSNIKITYTLDGKSPDTVPEPKTDIKLMYSIDDGLNYIPIDNATYISNETYDWNIPRGIAGKIQFRAEYTNEEETLSYVESANYTLSCVLQRAYKPLYLTDVAQYQIVLNTFGSMDASSFHEDAKVTLSTSSTSKDVADFVRSLKLKKDSILVLGLGYMLNVTLLFENTENITPPKDLDINDFQVQVTLANGTIVVSTTNRN